MLKYKSRSIFAKDFLKDLNKVSSKSADYYNLELLANVAFEAEDEFHYRSSLFGSTILRTGKVQKFRKSYFYRKKYLKLKKLFKKKRLFNCVIDGDLLQNDADRAIYFNIINDSLCVKQDLRDHLWKGRNSPTEEWYY